VICLDQVDGTLTEYRHEDGSVFEARVPVGAPYDGADCSVMGALPKGIFMGVYMPRDRDQFDDPYMYISVWVPNNN